MISSASMMQLVISAHGSTAPVEPAAGPQRRGPARAGEAQGGRFSSLCRLGNDNETAKVVSMVVTRPERGMGRSVVKCTTPSASRPGISGSGVKPEP